jgi:hypothetical protein
VAAVEVGRRPLEERLGLAPPAQLAQQAGLHRCAVAVQEHRDHAARADEATPAQQLGPRGRPVEVGAVVAGGEERARRLAGHVLVVARPAHQRHRLVEHRHALLDPPGLDVGEAAVGEGLGLEVHVAEAPGPVECEVGALEQLVGVPHVAAHGGDRRPALLDARWLVGEEGVGAREPGPAGRQVAEGVAEQVTQLDAHHGRLALLPRLGQRPEGARQVGEHRLDVEAVARLGCQLEGPGRVRHRGHALQPRRCRPSVRP